MSDEPKPKFYDEGYKDASALYQKQITELQNLNDKLIKFIEDMHLPCDITPTMGHTRDANWWQAYLEQTNSIFHEIKHRFLKEIGEDATPSSPS